MSKTVKLRKGLNIRLKGAAELVYASVDRTDTFALKPTDFIGLVPKMLLKPGAEVLAGTPLFSDKYNEKIVITSPVSGEVVEVVRGEKRRILEVRILADKEDRFEDFGAAEPGSVDRDQIIDKLLKSGVWPVIRQRPFASIANPEDKPKSIFISAFDTSPLAPDYDFILHGHGEDFQYGLDIVAKLTEGKVHLNVNGNAAASKVFTNSKNVQVNKVSGPHPAGNVGVQIHHIDPVNKGEVVWYLSPQDVLVIGRLFKTGKYDASKTIAVGGSSVKTPKYYQTKAGTSIKNIIANNVEEGEQRFISGNVLTGSKISEEGYLGFYDSQITIIPEGKDPEFMGWLIPTYARPSMSKTYLSTWLGALGSKKEFTVNTNLHGEERAFVLSGQYEKVVPMDIYPVHLLKSILVGDIEKMENLGIYEVAEEDFALCEFVCTSKIEVQEIVREGLDMMKEEMG